MLKKDRLLVENYHYLESFAYLLIAICPPFIRRLIYKVIFKEFGKNIHIGEGCYFEYPWKIRIGDDSNIGKGCQIYPSYQFKDVYVTIGKNVMIAPNCTIFGAGHPIDSPIDTHIAENVTIHDNVYIGGNVTIRYGVEIGSDSVIAAGSVIVKDVLPKSIVGGNPAKEIGRR